MFALLSRNRYLFPLTNFWIFYKIVKILKDIASSDLLYLLIIVQSPSYIYRLKNVLVLWTFLMRFQDSMVFLFFCCFFLRGEEDLLLREKCPYSDLFWSVFLSYLDWTRRDTPNMDTFTQRLCLVLWTRYCGMKC